MNETGLDYEDYGDYETELEELLWPNALELGTLPVFGALLVVGLTGNAMVVFVVLSKDSMRTVTNMFLLNLALADFLVLLFCLPPSILWDVTKTWWLGTPMCKAILYMQNTSVAVSVLTLVAISVERWYAICNPLQFKSTMERTLRLLVAIWSLALLTALPEALTVTAQPHVFAKRPNFTTTWATQCADNWGPEVQKAYQLAQSLLLFAAPLTVIALMYGNIAFDLWLRSQPPGDLLVSETPSRRPSARPSIASCRPDSASSVPAPRDQSGRPSVANGRRASSGRFGRVKESSKTELRGMAKEMANRRKAAKMLMAVVVLFFVCFLPVHAYNLSRAWGARLPSGEVARVFFTFSCRFLVYLNSSVNPILYNFMCERFQKEFRRVCCCLPGFRGRRSTKRSLRTTVHGSTRVTRAALNPPSPRSPGSPSTFTSHGRAPANLDSVTSPLLRQVLEQTHYAGRRGCSMADISEVGKQLDGADRPAKRPVSRKNSFTSSTPL